MTNSVNVNGKKVLIKNIDVEDLRGVGISVNQDLGQVQVMMSLQINGKDY